MKLSHKIAELEQSFCVRLTAQKISEIDFVPLRFLDCAHLFLSHNYISNLKNIDQFRNLSRLMIEYNNLCFLEDIEHLKNLPKLYELRLEGNPVCRQPLWDIKVIDMCQNLCLLNGKVVRGERKGKQFMSERTRKKIVYDEKDLIKNIVICDSIAKILAKINEVKKRNKSINECELIEDELIKSWNNLVDLKNQVIQNSPSKEIDGYFQYLNEVYIDKQKDINSKIGRNSPVYQPHFSALQNFMKCPLTEKEKKASLMRLLTSHSLQTIGFNLNSEITEKLAQNPENIIQDCLQLSKIDSSNMFDTLSNSTKKIRRKRNKVKIVYKPELSIEKSLNVKMPTTREYNPHLETVNSVFEFEIGEDDLKNFLESDGSSSSSNNNDDLNEAKGLTFDQQMEQEITESEAHLQDSISSEDSYQQKQQILKVVPTITTIPISDISQSNSGNSYSPTLHDNTDTIVRRFVKEENTDSSEGQAAMAKINNNIYYFFVKKSFNEWRRVYFNRINKKIRRNALSKSSDSSASAKSLYSIRSKLGEKNANLATKSMTIKPDLLNDLMRNNFEEIISNTSQEEQSSPRPMSMTIGNPGSPKKFSFNPSLTK